LEQGQQWHFQAYSRVLPLKTSLKLILNYIINKTIKTSIRKVFRAFINHFYCKASSIDSFLTSSAIDASFSTIIAFSPSTFYVAGSSSYICSGCYIFSSSLASIVAAKSYCGDSSGGG